MLTKCAEVAWDNGADLEMVDDWIVNACGSTPAIEELCNSLLRADEIPYYEYSCKGSVLEESFGKSWWFECMVDRSEYSQVWRPCAQVGRSLLAAKVTGCSQRRSLSATLAFEPARLFDSTVLAVVFAHVHAACVVPDDVMHDAVHDRVGMRAASEPLVPAPS